MAQSTQGLLKDWAELSNEETDEGAIDKDDNYTHSEPQRISALKLTQTMKNVHLKTTYMVMAASIPILLIVLIIVALIF